MAYQAETPFDSIESAQEYVNYLLEATQETQAHIETEIARAADPRFARRKQALQIVNYKLLKLYSHVSASRRLLNDLRTLRRLLLEERKTSDHSPIPSAPVGAEIEEDEFGEAFPSERIQNL
jgi:uncharacterized membrane protein YccC